MSEKLNQFYIICLIIMDIIDMASYAIYKPIRYINIYGIRTMCNQGGRNYQTYQISTQSDQLKFNMGLFSWKPLKSQLMI